MTELCLIHVVDDDGPVRAAFVFALKAVGYRAVDYDGADDFLTRGYGERGVLLSDIRMPGINGIELTRRLRREGSTMPIILMTGHADSNLHTDAMTAGADLVVGKPVVLDELIDEIARMTSDWE